ncbi:uncharacterized protein [Spinacia oleracea]|uniref:Uncharacterized protein isoform X2 n=1 Tax=Spinacia oleracea TaxID=3562 RepID=A0ABM3RD93_SPIOL|nr:uncharacterized protein LOC110788654 isoform X2 [Spinacia oleracea]
MVNVVSLYLSILHYVMKLAGMQSKEVEIEPGTVIRFWVNNNDNDTKKMKKKPPLVLIHGFAGDGLLTWQFQVLALRNKYSIFIPDLLFFGGSYTSKTDRSPKFQAECLAIGLRKLGVEDKCVVVGFSYGGFVGFQMAQHHPHLVASLVVSGAVVSLSESISSKCLEKIGFSSWPELLMPTSAEGVKVLLDVGSSSLTWMPNFVYKHYFQVMFGNRKERVELLEALVVNDEDDSGPTHQFQQKIGRKD